MDDQLAQANPRGVDVHVKSGPQMREYDAIADRIAADAPRNVLDWGCGLGQMTKLMTDRGLDVTAFDYSDSIASDEQRPFELYPELQEQLSPDPVRLPYADGQFAAVLSCGVLEHVLDPVGSLAEVRRVLEPGGKLYVYKLPYRYSYLEKVAKRAGMYYHGAHSTDRLYSLREATTLLELSGYQVLEARRANMLPLTFTGPKAARQIWRTNLALSRVPGLNLIATNIELIAVKAPNKPA